jgi:hypothetical protein
MAVIPEIMAAIPEIMEITAIIITTAITTIMAIITAIITIIITSALFTTDVSLIWDRVLPDHRAAAVLTRNRVKEDLKSGYTEHK